MCDDEAELTVLTSGAGPRTARPDRGHTRSPDRRTSWPLASAIRGGVDRGRTTPGGCPSQGSRRSSRMAGSMWLSSTGAEQATAELVARHKARGSRRPPSISPSTCVAGSVAIPWPWRPPDCACIAIDLDRTMTRRTAWNAEVHGTSDRVLAVRCTAERFPIPPNALVHIDPDRRTVPGRRSPYHRRLRSRPRFPLQVDRLDARRRRSSSARRATSRGWKSLTVPRSR